LNKVPERTGAYYPLIRHKPRGKQGIQQLILPYRENVFTGLLANYDLDIHRENHRHTHTTTIVFLRIFVTAGTCSSRCPQLKERFALWSLVPRNYRNDTNTDKQMGEIYGIAVQMDSSAMNYMTNFIKKIDSDILQLILLAFAKSGL
jgi:hypothetical protein